MERRLLLWWNEGKCSNQIKCFICISRLRRPLLRFLRSAREKSNRCERVSSAAVVRRKGRTINWITLWIAQPQKKVSIAEPVHNPHHDALRSGNTEWLRTVPEPDRIEGEFQRQGRGEGATREIPHCQIRIAPDEFDQEAIGRRNVVVRWVAETLWSPSKWMNRRFICIINDPWWVRVTQSEYRSVVKQVQVTRQDRKGIGSHGQQPGNKEE